MNIVVMSSNSMISQIEIPSTLELTILMPCLNEAETIETCVKKARAWLDQNHVSGEVLVADNGSTDGSQEIAQCHGARVVNVPTRGYGAAIHYGSLSAHGKFIVVGDSDNSYDFSNLEPFLERLRAGDDLVMGNRFLGGIKPGAMPWKNRYIGNPILTAIGRIFFKCPSGDFHCGLRGYSRDAYRLMDMRTTGMEFASEMVIKSTLLGLTISEVPTTLTPDGRSRPPHLRPWRDGWRHLVFMLLYSPSWLFFYPGAVLFFLGCILMAWLWPGQRRIGSLTLDVHTMLYGSMAMLVGFQGIAFAVLTKVFSINERLRPPDSRFMGLFRYIKLETGLIVGLILILAGLGGTISAFLSWNQTEFGQLNPTQTMRLVIPSASALTLGCEIIMVSFFLSILGLQVRRIDSRAQHEVLWPRSSELV